MILAMATSTVLDDAPFLLPEAPIDTDLVAKYFRALGDPTRVRILELVAREELSVGELVGRVGRPQPRVSDHLRCLAWCGYVKVRREGRNAYYSVSDGRVLKMLRLGESMLRDNFEHVEACEVIK